VIARHRGDIRAHSRWRPASSAGSGPVGAGLAGEEPAHGSLGEPPDVRRGKTRWRLGAVVLIATAVAVAAIAFQVGPGPKVGAALPATPWQWVDQWSAAALENPGVVCGRLYSPALAAAFKTDTGRSCTWYYGSVTSVSFRVRHLLQDGPTAAVEAQELGQGRRWGYFTMVLSHVGGGWQAVDVVPGGSVRPR